MKRKEIWKPTEYCEDYLVSNYGRIMSFKRKIKIGIILKPKITKVGYCQIKLFNHGEKRYFAIHRLVMESFSPNLNSEEFDQVNHIDENKENNYFENLEWCSGQYNTEYSQSKKYKILYPDGYIEDIFNLSKFCKENVRYNLSPGNLSQTCLKGWYHRGFRVIQIKDKYGNIIKSKK